MRSFISSRSSSSAHALLLLAAATVVSAGPYPKDDLHDVGYSFLMPRGCQAYCGSDNQYCCGAGEVCATQGNVATCLAEGSWGYTTTWTETRTYTSTIMTHWLPVPKPTAGVDCVPQNSEQQACGPICCAGWQTCAFSGQCSAKPGYAEPSTIVITSNGVVTTQYSAPFRVTGTTTVTTHGVVSTGSAASATTTGDGEAIGASGSGTNNGGLSPGAIAGIVIGTLAGVALLLLLCFCCIARGLWAAIFGKKKEHGSVREEVIEERFSKHGGSRVPSAYSRRERHSGWFGRGGGGASSVSERREKKKSGAKWLGIGAAAATLLALLNLKKDKRPASHKTPSRYSDSYYSYSDYTTSPSSASSGGRTQRTHRSRDSRGTRRSQYTRTSKRP